MHIMLDIAFAKQYLCTVIRSMTGKLKIKS